MDRNNKRKTKKILKSKRSKMITKINLCINFKWMLLKKGVCILTIHKNESEMNNIQLTQNNSQNCYTYHAHCWVISGGEYSIIQLSIYEIHNYYRITYLHKISKSFLVKVRISIVRWKVGNTLFISQTYISKNWHARRSVKSSRNKYTYLTVI